jgi:invasion protein IalB
MALAVLAASAWPAGAQEATPAPAQAPAAPAPTWTVNCTGSGAQEALTCSMSQYLIVKESGQRVLTAIVLKRDGKTLLNLGLPHGLNLPKGVAMWIDDGQRTSYPILTADPKGSYATVELTSDLLEALRKGTTMHVMVTSFRGDEIVLQLTLAGFTAGYAKL